MEKGKYISLGGDKIGDVPIDNKLDGNDQFPLKEKGKLY